MRLLAERGARIVAIDRKAPDLQTAVKDCRLTAEALAITADVTSEDEVADYVRAGGSINSAPSDVFYNNAGIEGHRADTKYPLESSAGARRQRGRVVLGLKHVLRDAEAEKGLDHQYRLDRGVIGSPTSRSTAQASTR